MSAIINSATLDKPNYAPGETMRLAIEYTADRLITVTTVIQDAGGNLSAPAHIEALCGAVNVTSNPPRAWTLVSDDGSTAILTATA